MDLQGGVVYGPAATRRLGRALVVNLAPAGRKACNFECAYCTHGWSELPAQREWPTEWAIVDTVERALATRGAIDTVVIAGNGEPTLHPAFARIADGLFSARSRYAPEAKLALLSNASTLNRLNVRYSLERFDVCCMKLDAGDATTFREMNGPAAALGRIVADLKRVSRLTLVSTFVRTPKGGGNAAPPAVRAWLDVVNRIRPAKVDVCTPGHTLRSPLLPLPESALEAIAAEVRALGINAQVFA